MQSRDSNTQLLANSIAATGKLGKELSEAVAANIIDGMNPRECYLLLAGHRGWLWFAPPGNMFTAAVKIATAYSIDLLANSVDIAREIENVGLLTITTKKAQESHSQISAKDIR